MPDDHPTAEPRKFCRTRRLGVAQTLVLTHVETGATITATLLPGGRAICVPKLDGWLISLDKSAGSGKDSPNAA